MSLVGADATRPMLEAADLVAAGSRALVTYEDPALPQVPAPADPLARPASPKGVLGVTGHAVDDPVAELRRAAAEYEALGYPGRFEVVGAAPMIHVIGFPGPATPGGVSTSPLLDREISMPAVTGSGLAFLAALVESLDRASPVGVGVVPFNALDRHQGRWPARRRSARAVLRDFVLPIGEGLCWALLYDPRAGRFTLNLQ